MGISQARRASSSAETVRETGENSTTQVGRGTPGRLPPPTSPLSGAAEKTHFPAKRADSSSARARALGSRVSGRTPSMARVGMLRPASA